MEKEKKDQDAKKQKGKKNPYSGKKQESKGRGPKNSQNPGKPESDENKDPAKGTKFTSNPVELYYTDEVTAKLLASFPYSIPVGIPLDFGTSDSEFVSDARKANVAPSLMYFRVVPTYGRANAPADAINVAARAIDAFVRKGNSGSKNYESSDLMTMFMGVDQIYVLFHYLRKLLRLVVTYSQENRTIPTIIFNSYNIDLQDAVRNYANYVGMFNVLVDKMNRQFAIPKTLNIFTRRDIVFSNTYVDSTSMKGQIYDFQPAGYYQWTGVEAGGSSLKWIDGEGKLYSTSEVLTIGNILDLINNEIIALMRNQDIAIMCGDVVKAYGMENMAFLTKMTEFEPMLFAFDETVLSQIENATILGSDTDISVNIGDIVQVNNTLRIQYDFRLRNPQAYTGKGLRAVLGGNRILNSHIDTPDWKFNLEATRLMAAVVVERESGGTFSNNIFCGTELITAGFISTALQTNRQLPNTLALLSSTANVYANTLESILWASQFDWHPIFHLFVDNTTDSKIERYPVLGDLKQYTLISNSNIARVHDYALMSLFNASFGMIKQ